MGKKETRIREASGRDRLVPEIIIRSENKPSTGGFRCEDLGNSIFWKVSLSCANIYFHAIKERAC